MASHSMMMHAMQHYQIIKPDKYHGAACTSSKNSQQHAQPAMDTAKWQTWRISSCMLS
jgi:hypothetical protein